MIPPQELKNKSFTRTGKGYDAAEVDEYMDFVVEKYSEIFAQCVQYDKKLRGISARIGEIKSEEETIHKLVISTQKNCDRLLSEAEEDAKNKILGARETAERILSDAREKAQSALFSIERKAAMQIEATQEKSDALLLSARTRCTRLLSDFKKEIAVQRENILNIKTISEEFNSKLLSMYKNHLNLLNENTYIPLIDLEGLTESKLFDSVMQEIKNDAGEIAKKNANVEYDFEKELESLRAGMDFTYDVSRESDVRVAGKTDRGVKPEIKPEPEPEDVKVFVKPAAENADGEKTDDDEDEDEPENETEEDDEPEEDEKPQATYDSDDYEYDGYNKGGGTVFDDDEFNGPDEDDEAEEADEESGTKGFWGFFKNKKSKRKKPPRSRYEPDDDEDDDEDDEDDDGLYEDPDDDDDDD